ncbi:sulfurtransferase [Desulfoluna limicola]|uniref:Sulfurtransferase n=1 Tax=Desulfoluna limicola TaxID=2810562 RepID=A0ABN6F0S1_9BACT|nr:rhodanese-like domain-containing protein [Desulfoluna limicola]BCS96128.1 sulfurtransferase [Desulfoluna limicola]
MMHWGRYVVRMGLLLVASAAVALVWNALSPWGLPLVGQWNAEVGVVTAVPDAEESAATVQTVDEARALWESRVVFLDARDSGSYLEGHIKGAVSLSVYDFESRFFDFMDVYPPEAPLVVYCSGRLCDESHRLAVMLKDAGYVHVRIFADGMPAWVAAGLPVGEGK